MYRRPTFDIWGREETQDDARFRDCFASADFDPVTMTAISGGMALAGGATSALGTLAGGSNASKAGQAQANLANFESAQDVENSAADIASAQRSSQDVLLKGRLAGSRAVATAGGGGVNASTGSAVTNEAQIADRSRYAAALDLWNGQNQASADLNKAAAAQYSGMLDIMGGNAAKRASDYAAAGTLASAGASAFKLFGNNGIDLTKLYNLGATAGAE